MRLGSENYQILDPKPGKGKKTYICALISFKLNSFGSSVFPLHLPVRPGFSDAIPSAGSQGEV